MDQSQIPKENGISKESYSSHQELSSKAQLGSSTESKVIMETTRTTSATMRLEHKPNFQDLPPITFSQRTQTPTIPLVSEGTMVDKDLSVGKQSEQTQTDAPKQPEKMRDIPIQMEEPPVGEPMRKSAYEFFENNLKNLPPLSEDKYTRFEDAMKSNKTYVHKQQEVKENFASKLNEDLSFFNLKPEPPAELAFMPKTQPITPPEKIIEKVKRLEESHQASETPLSGTIHLPIYKKEEKFEKKEFVSTKSTSPFVPKVPTPSFSPHVQQLIPDSKIERCVSPKPSAEGVNMEKLWAMKPKSPEPFALAPIQSPQLQQQQSHFNQQSFTHEHKSSFVSYSSQKTFKQETVEPPKEHFVPIQPYTPEPQQQQQQEELPKLSIKDTKSFFEQRIKEEEVKSASLDLKAPGLVKQFAKPMVPLVPDNYDLGIEPGAPPEICYAPKPVLERKQSYVEKIEKSLEQNIEKEPERVPRGGVRIFPQRQTPQRTMSQSPQRFQSPKPAYQPPKPVFQAPEPVQQPPAPLHFAPQPEIKPEPEPIFKQQHIIPVELPSLPPQTTPEPFAPRKFETQEFKSENVEIKKEGITKENISGYRHVEPPKFLQREKPSDPTYTAPQPKFGSPLLTKSPEPVTREIPISFQKQEPPKQPAPQPTYQNYEQKTQQQSFLYKSAPPKPLTQQAPEPIYQNYQTQTHKEQSFSSKTETITQSGPQPVIQPGPQPMYYNYQTQPKPIVKPEPMKPKSKFGEFVSETTQSFQSMYKNFVKSEENQNSTESYFQRIASPKTVSQQPQTPTQSQSQINKPDQSQVRKKFYPDVML